MVSGRRNAAKAAADTPEKPPEGDPPVVTTDPGVDNVVQTDDNVVQPDDTVVQTDDTTTPPGDSADHDRPVDPRPVETRVLATDVYVRDPDTSDTVILPAGQTPDPRYLDQLGEHVWSAAGQ